MKVRYKVVLRETLETLYKGHREERSNVGIKPSAHDDAGCVRGPYRIDPEILEDMGIDSNDVFLGSEFEVEITIVNPRTAP